MAQVLGPDFTDRPSELRVAAEAAAAVSVPQSLVDGATIDLRGAEPLVDLGDAERIVPVVPERVPGGLLAARRWQLVAKRVIDIVGSLVALVLLCPLMLTVALAIRLTSEGPAVYAHKRIGRDGRPFRMLKFRSMSRDAHLRRDEHAELNELAGPVFKIRNDPRITPIGRVLRRLSIDELPQLVNVLVGQMSLVGPRPPLPEEYAAFTDRERQRLAVKPGLTCVWQVSGRSDLDFETWVEMDIEYIDTWTLRLDLVLLALTIPAVVRGRGAY